MKSKTSSKYHGDVMLVPDKKEFIKHAVNGCNSVLDMLNLLRDDCKFCNPYFDFPFEDIDKIGGFVRELSSKIKALKSRT